jgi:hypothetical protein
MAEPIVTSSGGDTPLKTGDNGSGTVNPVTGNSPAKEYSKDDITKSFSHGLQDANDRLMTKLREQGYSGTATKAEEAFAEMLKGSSEPKKPVKKATEGDEESETLRLQVKKLEEERDTAKAQSAAFIADTELTTVLAGTNRIVDNGLAKAKTLFKAEYDIKSNADGEIRVYKKNGDLVRNERMSPASVSDVINTFLGENDFLLKSTVKGSKGNSTNAQSSDFMSVFNSANAMERKRMSRELLAGKTDIL